MTTDAPIEDDRRIFQALCTERDRLTQLLGYDRENVNRDRTEQLTAARDHTARLVERYAAKVREAREVTVFDLNGNGGAGRCHWCNGRLERSWLVRYTDNTWRIGCSLCTPRLGSVKE